MNLGGVLQEFKDALIARYADRLVKVIVYGSYARGTATPNSDLDLVLVFRDAAGSPSSEIDRMTDLLAQMNLKYGVLISVVPVSREAFETTEGPFWRTVRQEGVVA